METSQTTEFTLRTNVSEDDIREFLTRRAPNLECSACGGKHWTLMTELNSVSVLIGAARDGAFNIPPPVTPVVNLACNNCFSIRSHALVPIVDWRNSGKPG